MPAAAASWSAIRKQSPRYCGKAASSKSGKRDRSGLSTECVRIGEAMSTHLIHQVKQAAPETDLVIIDSPPGTSCPVIESVRGADFVLLVTEPTPFGLNDLKLAVEMVRAMKLPVGVVINRAGSGDHQTSTYCHTQGIDILSEIPDDRRVAEAYSRGVLASEAMPEIRARFESLLRRLMGEALSPAGRREVSA